MKKSRISLTLRPVVLKSKELKKTMLTEKSSQPKIMPISSLCKITLLDKLEIADGQESNVGSYKCQIPGVSQSTDSVNVYFTKKLTVSPSTNPIYRHNTAAQISFTCTYTKAGL